jgi:oxepin-CoA hydrolase / 3-oxo-5,6-dehydrosuberyl-CoA semialdehyde dehydrogenase
MVCWLVDIYDETGETVAIATILTTAKKKNHKPTKTTIPEVPLL